MWNCWGMVLRIFEQKEAKKILNLHDFSLKYCQYLEKTVFFSIATPFFGRRSAKKWILFFIFLFFVSFFWKIYFKLFIYKGTQEKKIEKLTFILKKWKIKFTFFQSDKQRSGKNNIIFLVFLKWLLNFLIFFPDFFYI